MQKLIPNIKEEFGDDIDRIVNLYFNRLRCSNTIDIHDECKSTGQLLKLYVEDDSYEVSEECVQSILINEQYGLITIEEACTYSDIADGLEE